MIPTISKFISKYPDMPSTPESEISRSEVIKDDEVETFFQYTCWNGSITAGVGSVKHSDVIYQALTNGVEFCSKRFGISEETINKVIDLYKK